MVNLTHYVLECEEFHLIREAISVTDLSLSEESCPSYEKDESGYVREDCLDTKDDEFLPKTELEKVRILVWECEAIVLDTTIQDLGRKFQKQREKRKEKQARSKGRKRQLVLSNKMDYLLHVEAKNCIKTHKIWKATLLHSIKETNSTESATTTKSRREKRKIAQALAESIS